MVCINIFWSFRFSQYGDENVYGKKFIRNGSFQALWNLLCCWLLYQNRSDRKEMGCVSFCWAVTQSFELQQKRWKKNYLLLLAWNHWAIIMKIKMKNKSEEGYCRIYDFNAVIFQHLGPLSFFIWFGEMIPCAHILCQICWYGNHKFIFMVVTCNTFEKCYMPSNWHWCFHREQINLELYSDECTEILKWYLFYWLNLNYKLRVLILSKIEYVNIPSDILFWVCFTNVPAHV